jgi:hypothetical protein
MDAQPVSAIRRSSVELPVEGLDGMFDQGSHSLIRNGRRRSPDCAWRAAVVRLFRQAIRAALVIAKACQFEARISIEKKR